MQVIMPDSQSDLATWLSYLEQIHPKTIDLGLNRVKTVAQRMNLLTPAPYIFTVAGTNGKGTTCRALEMMLLAAGFNVGVYSSPHLLRFTERVRINNQESREQDTVQSLVEIERQRSDISLTYFEYGTLSALYQFKQANLDVVILEVGLGGRLDATNIIDADIAVITSIAIDHVDYLGDTRESIGQEKAGIFKSKSVAVVGEPDVPSAIFEVAKRVNCPLFSVNSDWQYSLNPDNSWDFCLTKRHYQHLPIPNIPLPNAATAVAALSYASLNVTPQAIITGLQQVSLMGRFQTIKQHPHVIVDVAHNPHAAHYLQSQLESLKNRQQQVGSVRFVVGMLKDKDIKMTLSALKGDVWYCASLYGERGANAAMLRDCLYANGVTEITVFDDVSQAFTAAMQDAQPEDIIVVCGSFYTVADVLSQLNDLNV